ncbi:hypothetical protein SprV_0702286300 [Sparganum proliferum]
MSRNLGAGVISPHRCSVFGHSRSELSSGFSDVVALSATAPDPINDSRRFLPWQRVFRFHYQTPDGCLRSVCNSNPKWCEKATDSFRNVLDIRKRPRRFGVRAVRPSVSFAYAPVDEVARVAIGFEYPFLSDESDTTVSSSAQFLEKLKGDLAIETIELLLQSKYDETENHLGHAQILHLLKLCLRTYFTFDGTVYEQVKGTPMGSPISVFIADAVLQRLEWLVFQHHRPEVLGPVCG